MTAVGVSTGGVIARGDALYAQDRRAEAAAAYEHAVDVGEDRVAALHKLMATRAMLGELDRAQAAAHRALAMDEADATAVFWLGYVARQRGDLPGAVGYFQRALELAPAQKGAAAQLRQVRDELAARQIAGASPAGGSPGSAGTPAGAPATVGVTSSPAAKTPRPTLAELLEKGTEPSLLPGKAWWRGRPLQRSMVVDAWPAAAMLAVWLAVRGTTDAVSVLPWPGLTALATMLESAVWSAVPVTVVLTAVWAVLRWYTTEYVIYERRVDVTRGIVYRRHQVLWLYQIDRPIVYTRNLPQMLLGTGSIVLEAAPLSADKRWFANYFVGGVQWGRARLAAIEPHQRANEMAERLRLDVLRERRTMLDRFIGQ